MMQQFTIAGGSSAAPQFMHIAVPQDADVTLSHPDDSPTDLVYYVNGLSNPGQTLGPGGEAAVVSGPLHVSSRGVSTFQLSGGPYGD